MFNSDIELATIRARCAAGVDPQKGGYAAMLKLAGANPSNSEGSYPNSVVKSKTDIRYTAASAAYALALRSVVDPSESVRKACADKAIVVLNNFTKISISSAGNNHPLQLRIGWIIPKFLPGAEIISHYWPDRWEQSDRDRFARWLRANAVPILSKFYNGSCGSPGSWRSKGDGGWVQGCGYEVSPEFPGRMYTDTIVGKNWHQANNRTLAGIVARMCIGVYLDDEKLFNQEIERWKWALPRNVFPDGQVGEQCRDCTHGVMGLLSLIHGAEIAWQQGIDLYGERDNRLRKGIEFMADIHAGKSRSMMCQSRRTANCGSAQNLPGFRMGYNHYVDRLGLTMPGTREYIQKEQKYEGDRWNYIGWTTLTHGDMGNPSGSIVPPTAVIPGTIRHMPALDDAGRSARPDIATLQSTVTIRGRIVRLSTARGVLCVPPCGTTYRTRKRIVTF